VLALRVDEVIPAAIADGGFQFGHALFGNAAFANVACVDLNANRMALTPM
jgi:hypothetical protein